MDDAGIKTTIIGVPETVGELKKMLEKYPDELDFGFRNSPRWVLIEYEIEEDNYRAILFN